MHDDLKAAIERIHKAAVDNGKRTGIYCTSGEQSYEYAQKGFHMISISADMMAIPNYFNSVLSTARGEGVTAPKVTGPYGR